MVSKTDLHEEAYKRIDLLSDDDIKLIINIMDKINPYDNSTATADRKKKIRDMAGQFGLSWIRKIPFVLTKFFQP